MAEAKDPCELDPLPSDEDDDELPSETSMSMDRLYLPDDPWFTLIV